MASAANNLRTQSPELQKGTSAGTGTAAGTGPGTSSGPGTGNATPEAVVNLSGIPAASHSTLASTDEEKKRRILEQIDWRNYECKTWHLEPTVRWFTALVILAKRFRFKMLKPFISGYYHGLENESNPMELSTSLINLASPKQEPPSLNGFNAGRWIL